MKIYINSETLEYPKFQGHIRDDNPWITDDIQGDDFPNPPPAPYVLVADTPLPAHDPATQAVRELAPIQTDGVWARVWEVIALSPEQIAQLAEEVAEMEQRRLEAQQAYDAYVAAGGSTGGTFIEIP